MSIRVRLEAELGPLWASEEEFRAMTDKQLIELIKEYFDQFIEDGRWTVIRSK